MGSRLIASRERHAGSFGSVLRRRREEQGISLRELARRVAYSPGWLSKIENGVAPPAVKLAELCDKELAAGGALVALAHDLETKPGFGSLVPAQLPRGARPFVGRTDELRALQRCLMDAQQSSSGMTVAVDGAPGTGKSALVVHWAQSMAGHFVDGILHRDLGGHAETGAPPAPEEVLAGFLATLGVPQEFMPQGTGERAALFRSLVSARRMLVVLDDVASSRQVEPLLPGPGDSAVVVTGRPRMTGLAARTGAVRMSLGPLPTADALDLLGSVVGADRVRAEPDGARALAAHCAGLPLALRVAAEHLVTSRYRSMAGLAAELAGPGDPDDRFDVLVAGDQLTVRAAFETSYRRLDAESARGFRLLGLLNGGTVGAAAAAALLARPRKTARRTLERLVGVHLLDEVGPEQYRLGGLLALFAAGRATAEETEQGRAAALLRLAGSRELNDAREYPLLTG